MRLVHRYHVSTIAYFSIFYYPFFIQRNMELIERATFLTSLQLQFEKVVAGEGHCVFVSGEAGIGKTSLVKEFCKDIKNEAAIYTGTCDALFTPRPLSPLYDIAGQLTGHLQDHIKTIEDRAGLFARFFHELTNQQQPVVMIFEDIHWADEATLDFIKFFIRRITQTSCFFLLTYRDNEIHSRHLLRNIFGELAAGSFTRLQLLPLSGEAVTKLATDKGYSGEDVYSISGGNPFYVNEILASYSPGIPENIKDSILAVHNRQDEKTRYIWDVLSMLPTGLETKYLYKIDPRYEDAIENSLESRILIINNGLLLFKHELYRRTIEQSLSPIKRVAFNKRILDLFEKEFEKDNKTERIIHHAKNANAYELVVKYAPVAAKQAASVGAHIEASKLYFSAIEYYQGNDKDLLVELYESYAYECYLTNQHKEAIIYTGKSLNIWKKKNNVGNMGYCMRLLSRLWWFEGNREVSENFGRQAIEVLENQPSSNTKAMAYSNMAQLRMVSNDTVECISWGKKAIAIANEVNDEETLAHVLNCLGTVYMKDSSSIKKGIGMLQHSLEIALKNGYHEHVARAYTNLGSSGVSMKEYALAEKSLKEGIQYCDEMDLHSSKLYMEGYYARLKLETGYFNEANNIAGNLLKNENLFPVIKIGALLVVAIIKIRRGGRDVLPLLLEAKNLAFETRELQRIIPALSALLEYEWITGKIYVETEDIDRAISMMKERGNISKKSRLFYWLRKARKQYPQLKEIFEEHELNSAGLALGEAVFWEKLGCRYEQAVALFEGNEEDKRKAITIVHELGADAVYEKMKQEMRGSGIKKIPRGIRESTRCNPAQLTSRELDVLQLLKEGMLNKEIAGSLFISTRTVDHHISSIFFKLGVNSRTKAVQEATRLGVLK